jgi:hypothetical protein
MKKILSLILLSLIFYSCSSEDASNNKKTYYKVEYYGSLYEGFIIDSNRNIQPKLVFNSLVEDDFYFDYIAGKQRICIQTNSASFKFYEGTYKIIKQ